MCGIAGLIGVPGDRKALGLRLLSALRHRGPDDEGIEHPHPAVTLVHTRLSILDLSPAGHQPMSDRLSGQRNPNWVVFNGEIFNYLELQVELAKAGFPSRSRSDTEVILNAYRRWGPECVQRFRGMFSICLLDLARSAAFLYRDRLGIKPLFLYGPKQGGLVFASELRALLALAPELISSCVSATALESYLAQGAVQGYESLISGVTVLRPGMYLEIDLESGKRLRERTYWQLPAAQVPYVDRAEAVEQLSIVVRDAVRLRLISDVPLGLFLSGGVDSTALLALARQETCGELRTITVGFDIHGFDESVPAAATANVFGTHHQTVRLTGQDVLQAMPAVLEAMDQPTVDGTNTYFVSRAAREAGLTVALSGLGGDELFGGYATFKDVPRAIRLRRRWAWARKPIRLAPIRCYRSGAKLMEVLERPANLLSMYLLRRELFLPHERRLLHTLPAESDATTGIPQTLAEELSERSCRLDSTHQVSLFELELYMRHMLLRDADAFSMAAPIEYRVPFLDHELVETAFALPAAWKLPDPRPKPLLLDVAGPQLPTWVWRKPKAGFTFPWRAWLYPGGPMAEMAREAVRDREIWRQLGLNPAGASETWRRFVSGDRSVSSLQVLALVVLRDFASRHRLRAA